MFPRLREIVGFGRAVVGVGVMLREFLGLRNCVVGEAVSDAA